LNTNILPSKSSTGFRTQQHNFECTNTILE
jgi:hypothetical protein